MSFMSFRWILAAFIKTPGSLSRSWPKFKCHQIQNHYRRLYDDIMLASAAKIHMNRIIIGIGC